MSVKQCPWCERYSVKDEACNYVVCGRTAEGFVLGHGCGRAWCFHCGLRLCGRMYDEQTGAMLCANENHNHPRGSPEHEVCNGPGYCPGGHNAHKDATATLPTL